MTSGLISFSMMMLSISTILVYFIVSSIVDGSIGWAILSTIILIPVILITIGTMASWHVDSKKIGGSKKCEWCNGVGECEMNHNYDTWMGKCESCSGKGLIPIPNNADPNCSRCKGSGQYIPKRFFSYTCTCVHVPKIK